MIPTTTQERQRKVANAGIAAVVGGLLLSLFGTTLASATAGPPAKVTICHATASTSNPYQELSVNESSLNGGGSNDHTAHTGPVFDFSDPAGNHAWGDIVPSFGTFGGLNWTADGQDVYGHGCGDPAPPPVDLEPCTYDPQLTADDPACLPPVDPEPCTYDPQLTADDPACLPPVDPEPCTYDPQLTADDPACLPPVDPEPCTYDPQLTADDPACLPPVDPEPCTYDPQLTADDPACLPPVDPEPCTYDPQLTADDPACLPPVDPEPCTYDPQLTADDPACLAQVEDELLTPPVDSTPTDPGSSPTSGSLLTVSSSGEAGAPAVTTLPRTGRSVGPMATTGVSLLLLGVGILFMQRRTLLAHHRSSRARHMARSADRR